ncbi:hypothetical protein F0U63_08085 [Cystobacter fuscus]|nr:hypothetical protein F0U63_08085 [Cystobacter fuscus]
MSLEHAAVLADCSANAGGLLLTRLERPVGEWELTLKQLGAWEGLKDCGEEVDWEPAQGSKTCAASSRLNGSPRRR